MSNSIAVFELDNVDSFTCSGFSYLGNSLRSRNTFEGCSLFSFFNNTLLTIQETSFSANTFDLCLAVRFRGMRSLDAPLISLSFNANEISLKSSGFISVSDSDIDLQFLSFKDDSGASIKAQSSSHLHIS